METDTQRGYLTKIKLITAEAGIPMQSDSECIHLTPRAIVPFSQFYR